MNRFCYKLMVAIGVFIAFLAFAVAQPSRSCHAQHIPAQSPEIIQLTNQGARLLDDDELIDFSRDVIPVLTQAGCNSGACHGAAAGRGYLTLSLFGSRPDQDHETLVHALPDRFVDLQQPASSLILQKAGGFLEHGGGERLASQGPAFALIQQWIAQSAPRGQMTELTSLTIAPSSIANARVSQPLRLSVMTTWSDGSSHDMTRWATIVDAQPLGTPNATLEYQLLNNVLELTPRIPGYWPVTVRVGKQAAAVQLFVKPNQELQSHPHTDESAILPTGMQEPSGLTRASSAIDVIVMAANRRVDLEVAKRCSSSLLARRLWLDLLGRHPSMDEWNSAIDEIERGQVAQLVDRLLASQAFAQHAGNVVASWVAAHSRTNRNTDALAQAICDEVLLSDDLQQLVRRMLLLPREDHKSTATARANDERLSAGHPVSSSLTEFHHFAGDPRQRAELVAATWLGLRLGCAQCHDHPLDHWTQDDYFAMSACWAEIESDGKKVYRIPGRTTTDLRDGREAKAKVPFSVQPLSADAPRQVTTVDVLLVDWLCATENLQFSRNLANRVWAWFLGSGLVVELDDHRLTNPAIHNELLEHLAERLRDNHFSLRLLVREIVLSDTYARVADSKSPLLHRQMLAIREAKPISRDILDLVSDAFPLAGDESTQATLQVPSMMVAMESTNAGCSRQLVCADPISESLNLVAGEGLNRIISEVVARASQSTHTQFDLLNHFHLQLFGRPLNLEEVGHLLDKLDGKANPRERLDLTVVEDIVWSWVVSPEFRQQH